MSKVWKFLTISVVVAAVAIVLRLIAPLIHSNIGLTSVDSDIGKLNIALEASDLHTLKGKSALVVGGTKGIGRGIAVQLAAAGAHVTAVGRSDGAEVVKLMKNVALDSDHQKLSSYSFDLSNLEKCVDLIHRIKSDNVVVDLLVFTIGVWPDPVQPRTAAGVDKTIATYVIARFTIFHQLQLNSLLGSHPVVLSVLASTKIIPLFPISKIKQIVSGENNLAITDFFIVGPVVDAILTRASLLPENKHIKFIGTYPGLVSTELATSSNTLPKWLVKIGFGLLSGLNLLFSEQETGLRHASILNAASDGTIKKQISFFDHELVGRHGTKLTTDADCQEWLWSYLSSLSQNKI